MELNDRKIKILEAIITDYVETGEPIGSRTIAKKYDLGISSATIRNEMSDLEELGLIEQLHTSSGRVPSDKGYRIYVDNFMTQQELSEEETIFLQNLVSSNINQMDYLMEQTAKALSMLTNYPTVVSQPKIEGDSIKALQLMPFDENSILVTLVTENKIIKNYEILTNRKFSKEEINAISETLGNIIASGNIEDVILSAKNIVLEQERIINEVLQKAITFINQNDEVKIFTSGINNILDFKEFNDINKAKSIFHTLEEKEMLINILENETETDSIQILIGDENDIEGFKECSIVKTEYKIAGAKGTIGIIAPTRMDYARAVSILNSIIQNINGVLKSLPPG